MNDSEEIPPPPTTFSQKMLVLMNSVKFKRLDSLFSGFASGIIMGIVIAALVVGQTLGNPFPAEAVTPLLVGAVFSVALLIWGVHKATTTK